MTVFSFDRKTENGLTLYGYRDIIQSETYKFIDIRRILAMLNMKLRLCAAILALASVGAALASCGSSDAGDA